MPLSLGVVIKHLAPRHGSLLARSAREPSRLATEILTHDVGPRVSPERSRGFERAAASALLLPRGASLESPLPTR